jgi:plasmid stabilization system protein ParE
VIRLVVRPLAKADMREAATWYEAEKPGLGDQLVDEIGEALSRIRRLPLSFPEVGRRVRRALLHRFPYAVYFLMVEENSAVVLAVLHQHRAPVAWKSRVRAEKAAR